MAGRNIKLQDLRSEKHWTLRAAAQHIGVTKTVLFNAEQGVMPRVDHAIQIAGQYNRSVEDLWAPLSPGEPLEPSSVRHDSPRKAVVKTSMCSRAASKPGGRVHRPRPRSDEAARPRDIPHVLEGWNH